MPAPSPAATAVEPRLTYVEPILSRYSRVAAVRGGRPVFISGLYGPSSDAVTQVTEMFEQLRGLLEAAGSNLTHLVKATYYVSETAADERINAIRPTLYDPSPPSWTSWSASSSCGR